MDDFFSGKKAIRTLKMISPGTDLRLGIDHVLKAKTGGLIVIADSDEVMSIVDGGFAINAEYSPAYLYELAKMDGAIVLSSDIKKILLQMLNLYQITQLKQLKLEQDIELLKGLQNKLEEL